jgi:hypothetical protein
MDDDKQTSDIPIILAGETGYGGRIVYFAGDVDRRYGDGYLPDLGDILASAVLWALRDKVPFKVEGPGELDCRLYEQDDALVLHVVNLSGINEWPRPAEAWYPVGPHRVSIKAGDRKISRASLKVAGCAADFKIQDDWVVLTLNQITSHEMVVLE